MRYIVAILVLLVALPLAAQTPDTTAPAPAPTVEVGTVTTAPAVATPEVIETPVVADPAPQPAVVDAVAPQLPDTAASIPVPQDEKQAAAQVGQAVDAFKVGQYVLGALLLLGVAVFIWRKYGSKK